MKTYLFTYSLAMLIALAVTPLVIIWARKRQLVDMPNARKIHTRPVPRLGGIALFVATMLSVIPIFCLQNAIGERFRGYGSQIVVLMVGGVVIFVLGLCDDIRGLRVRTRLGVEIIIVIVLCCIGIRVQTVVVRDMFTLHLGGLSYVITGLWMIGIMNAVNLIDGLDGLACGLSGIACTVMAALSMWQGNVMLAVLVLALLGSLTGFMFYNYYPARIFMGDCGSLFLGYILATSSVLTAAKAEALVGIGLPIVVLGIPIFDTLLSIVRRYLGRRGVMSPDRGHFHHRLLDLGFKQKHVAIMAYLITVLLTGLGLFMLVTRGISSVTVLVCCLVLLLFVFGKIGAIQMQQVLSGIRRRTTYAQHCLAEHQRFEVAQLQFCDIETFGDWWDCMCRAAMAMDVSCMTIAHQAEGQPCETLHWERGEEIREEPEAEDRMHLHVPLHSRNLEENYSMEIDIPAMDSLEMAGHRIALFARLADEYDLTSLPEKHQARQDVHTLNASSLEVEITF